MPIAESIPLPDEMPELPSDWSYVSLRELVNEERGITYGIVQPGQHIDGGVPIVRVQAINKGIVSTDDPLRVDPQIAAKHHRTTLRGGELLLTVVGSVGQTAIATPNLKGWNTARAVAVLPVRHDIDPYYLHYCLRSPALQRVMENWCNTTVQATLNLKEVAELPIPMAPETERIRIVRFLRAIDDKIEANRSFNRDLASASRALFQSWFVDFDPVVAKAEGRQPFGVPSDMAVLFPAEFTNSEIGPVPKGWRIGRLGAFCELGYGKALPEPKRVPGPFPVMGSDGIIGWHNQSLVKGPGVVVGRKGNAGRVNWVDDAFFPIDTTYYVKPLMDLPISYLHLALETLDLAHHSGDSAVPGLNREMAYGLKMVVPPTTLASTFGDLIAPMRLRILSNSRQSHSLAALRDALLPELLSGNLRLADAERRVEHAL